MGKLMNYMMICVALLGHIPFDCFADSGEERHLLNSSEASETPKDLLPKEVYWEMIRQDPTLRNEELDYLHRQVLIQDPSFKKLSPEEKAQRIWEFYNKGERKMYLTGSILSLSVTTIACLTTVLGFISPFDFKDKSNQRLLQMGLLTGLVLTCFGVIEFGRNYYLYRQTCTETYQDKI